MDEKKNDGKRHRIQSRKSTPGHHGKAGHRRFLKLPAPPRWIEAVMASLEGSSRLLLVTDANESQVLEQRPVGLSHIVGITGTGEQWTALLPPPPADRRHFAIMAVQDAGLFVPGAGKLVSARWVFALEWVCSRSPWDALMFTLEHIRPQVLAIPPAYLLPTMFVAGMAESSGDAALGTVASWGPVLEEVCQALDPFILALYLCWIDGPSQAAGVYRQRVEHMTTDGTKYRQLLEPFAGLLGSSRLEAVRCSERLEPAVIGTLSQVSTQLWDRSALPLHDQELSLVLDAPHLHALLPLALWRSPSPVEADLDIAHLHSLSDVLRIWKRHQGLA